MGETQSGRQGDVMGGHTGRYVLKCGMCGDDVYPGQRYTNVGVLGPVCEGCIDYAQWLARPYDYAEREAPAPTPGNGRRYD